MPFFAVVWSLCVFCISPPLQDGYTALTTYEISGQAGEPPQDYRFSSLGNEAVS
jgi:hypothetical protein